MTHDLAELTEFFDDDGITLPPIRSRVHPEGKRYFIESPDFETGILFQQLNSIAQRLAAGVAVSEEEAKRLKFNDEEEQTFSKLVLGDTLQQMLDDGVKWGPIQRATQYTFAYYGIGPRQAEKMVESFGPKAPTPTNRAAKRAKKRK